MKIRRGDTVVVITGKDKGKTGQVLKVLHLKNKVVVSDVNMRTRHKKKTASQAGEIIKYEASMSASNVSLIDPKTRKPTRAGWKIDEKTGKKTRIAKKSGEEIVRGKVSLDKGPKKAIKQTGDKKDAVAPAQAAVKEPQKKQAFWRKMGFGAEALKEQAEVDAGSHMHEDHSIPKEITRTSERGSRGS